MAGAAMETNELKNNIRKLRFERGEMTQQQLADMAGVTRQTIIAMEQGKYAPSLPLAFRIARAFGVGIEQVFEFTEKSDGNPASPSAMP
jgi:putative transcriptional regulator